MAGLFARFNAGERRIVAGLDDDEAKQLAHLLRKVLRTIGRSRRCDGIG